MNEARDLNHSYVGTEHLLLGLLREDKGIAAQVLRDFGATTEQARAETLLFLAQKCRRPIARRFAIAPAKPRQQRIPLPRLLTGGEAR